MKINRAGYRSKHSAEFCIDRPHGSGDCIFLVIRSRAWFMIDGEKTECEPDSFIIYEKDVPQLYGALGEEYENDWIHFDADEDDIALFERLEITRNRPIRLASTRALSEIIRHICDEMNSGGKYKLDKANLLSKMLWYELHELSFLEKNTETKAYYESFKSIRNDIYRSPECDHKIDSLARSVYMSRSYFQHLYAKFFGVSVTKDVIESKIAHAKHLLSSTDEKIGAIAKRCGYKSDVHFMRQFKKTTGITPSQFRSTY